MPAIFMEKETEVGNIKDEKCLVLLSKNIFSAETARPVDGFVAIEGNRIAEVGSREQVSRWIEKADRIIDLGSKTVTPGFVDCHTFFSGYLLLSIGVDFSQIKSDKDGVEAIKSYSASYPDRGYVFGHGWRPETFSISDEGLLDREFPDKPVVIFSSGQDNCWMNRKAREKFGFAPEKCYAEMLWRMMPFYLNEPETERKYVSYMRMLNERGITSIKEMTFDDYYGFADTMERLEKNGEMTVRVSFMSQPVGRGIDLEHGRAMKKRFTGDFLKFSGYNRMTDRGIARFLGELNEPYKSNPDTKCMTPVEWGLIGRETLEADKNGFRFSLHCQGDGAFRHTVDLYSRCAQENGRLVNRHAVTDLEFTRPEDLERFGSMGGIAEIYAQIQSLDNKAELISMIDSQLGMERGKYYWNRRQMIDSGICLTCGTDLPLLFPDVPQSIYCGCGGYFKDGKSFNERNMITVPEMLTAWTRNGQYSLGNEKVLGTLEKGKLADIAVLDEDIFSIPVEKAGQVKVCLTISNGRVVYEKP
ncbi:hypothetical protein LY28_03071 [Ruminiclostridium sufflavum DSM 19573]|uniref:Amidohydrolase 3 domain-containing protein n=1 Tax=Ruminiclostridium sufflavum DSM 19573 TaxID=1121337 RepID=A0A318XKJ7_9FIRM|nr:amidohydrolase family protein [Ruminiclostridium sufflavum]PYG85917.1 hypothetical protein LY28_03071 [Ruminiclostridium sufflavum DSM 19573]